MYIFVHTFNINASKASKAVLGMHKIFYPLHTLLIPVYTTQKHCRNSFEKCFEIFVPLMSAKTISKPTIMFYNTDIVYVYGM